MKLWIWTADIKTMVREGLKVKLYYQGTNLIPPDIYLVHSMAQTCWDQVIDP